MRAIKSINRAEKTTSRFDEAYLLTTLLCHVLWGIEHSLTGPRVRRRTILSLL